MRKENGLKEFFRTTYKTGSPIPYFISIQAAIFIIIHLCDLLVEINVINYPLYDKAVSNLGLPMDFSQFLKQPWSLVTYPFLYTGLFNIVFDCLWLYWMGNIFMSFLNKRQFLTLYLSSFLVGGLLLLALGQIDFLTKGAQSYLFTSSLGLAALVASLTVLVPKMELRLFIFGRVKFVTLAVIFLSLEFLFYIFANRAGAIVYLLSIAWGVLFMKQLQEGNDWSKIFKPRPKNNLRIVHTETKTLTYKSYKADLPNQDVIDEILDKISQSGYESLSSREKEILFKASREEQD
ncbi:rhomboid family intramembrane serine protease [Sphingobacterium sp. PU5-4]|uniref:Rhomboid family intramembrane serine protease n=1 Tax=Sphingobacterium tenebrionis TaxID=3111775 RepID=A0ABU8I3G2_9SPHI